MKTTKNISMLEFANIIGSIAKQVNEDYHNVNCKMQMYSYNKNYEFTFSAYINGYGHFDGKTPNQVITKVKAIVKKPKQIIKDVITT